MSDKNAIIQQQCVYSSSNFINPTVVFELLLNRAVFVIESVPNFRPIASLQRCDIENRVNASTVFFRVGLKPLEKWPACHARKVDQVTAAVFNCP